MIEELALDGAARRGAASPATAERTHRTPSWIRELSPEIERLLADPLPRTARDEEVVARVLRDL